MNALTIRLLFITALAFTIMAQGQNMVYSSNKNGNNKITYRTSNGNSSFNVEMRGKIELTGLGKAVYVEIMMAREW